MADLEDIERQHREEYGRALASLRDDVKQTQQGAADALGVSLQAWQNYEYGKRKFTRDLKSKTTAALGLTVEDLELRRNAMTSPANDTTPAARPERAFSDVAAKPFSLELPVLGKVRAGPKGVHVYDDAGEPETIDLSAYFDAYTRVLQLGGESMIPYAEPGGFVTYNLRRGPQRNRGCVIITKTGEYYVKRYEGIRDNKLVVTELHPVEREIEFDMSEVEGIYRVGVRLD